MFFIRTSPVQVFHTHTCILALGVHWDTCILLHLDTYTCILTLRCFLPLHWDTYRRVCVQVSVWKRQCSSVREKMSAFKCKCGSVSVEVSVFKGFSGRTLRNAFGKNHGCANNTCGYHMCVRVNKQFLLLSRKTCANLRSYV